MDELRIYLLLGMVLTVWALCRKAGVSVLVEGGNRNHAATGLPFSYFVVGTIIITILFWPFSLALALRQFFRK